MYVNTYCLKVFNIPKTALDNNCVLTHESQHLWEHDIQGLLVNGSNEFITVSLNGISVIALGDFTKRIIKTNDGKT